MDWSALAWPPQVAAADVAAPSPDGGVTTAEVTSPLPEQIAGPERWLGEDPTGYRQGVFYDPKAAQALFYSFAERNKGTWPLLPAIHDLALVGLYDISGPAMAVVYEEWATARRRRNARQVAVRKVQLDKRSWRQLFMFTRDHHHVARFSMGLAKATADPIQVAYAQRLTYPMPEQEHVYHWARQYNVDPLVAYGLMRAESLYRDTALSRVGATGLMQIMPATGSKVAALLGEPEYSPAMLEQPSINVRYGIFYLSQLLTRFEGAWPLAVASYNAGPVNVSSWYRGWQGKITIDDFVEQIPLKETRGYVKKVGSYYGTYTAVYGPEGAAVHVPRHPGRDDKEVVDF